MSSAGLLGGGDPVRPGEVTLAHHGVLCLDDLPEFRASVLESLAAVLRDGNVTLYRAGARTGFPANPLLLVTANLCPCGLAGTGAGRCSCSSARLATYRTCLDGPLSDRVHLRAELHLMSSDEVWAAGPSESSGAVRERVTNARALQQARSRVCGTAPTNGALTPHDLERAARQDASAARVLTEAVQHLDLSERVACRVLCVARTIADLAGSEAVSAQHIHEALTFAVSSSRSDAAKSCTAAA